MENRQNHPLNPSLLNVLKGHTHGIASLSLNKDRSHLASGSLDHSIMIWNLNNKNRPAFRLTGHTRPITCVDYHHQQANLLVSCSKDKTVRFWTPSAKAGKVSTVLNAHQANVRNVKFSNNSRFLMTCSDDKTIKIWSAPTPKFISTLKGHTHWVRTVAWSPHDSLQASGSDDKSVKIWDHSAKSSCIRTYLPGNGEVYVVKFNPAGTWVCAGCQDGSIKIYDLRTHKLVLCYLHAHDGFVSSLEFYNPRTLISGGGVDMLIKIWDLELGRLVFTLHGHRAGACSIAVADDLFVTAGLDKQIFVWNARDSLRSSPPPPVFNNLPYTAFPQSSSVNAPQRKPNQESHTITLGAPLFSETVCQKFWISILALPKSSLEIDCLVVQKHFTPPPSSTPVDARTQSNSYPLLIKPLPLTITTALDTIVSQLDMLTSTVQLFNHRLTACESHLNSCTLDRTDSKMQLKENDLSD